MREKTRQPFQPHIPQCMIHPVQQQGVHTRICCQHLNNVARRRVPVENANDVLTNADDISPV
jgi:hypothetical protein